MIKFRSDFIFGARPVIGYTVLNCSDFWLLVIPTILNCSDLRLLVFPAIVLYNLLIDCFILSTPVRIFHLISFLVHTVLLGLVATRHFYSIEQLGLVATRHFYSIEQLRLVATRHFYSIELLRLVATRDSSF